MSKLCGLIDPTASEQQIEERLHSMAQVMKHHPHSPEEYLLFEGGGIALIGNPSFTAQERRWATNQRHGSLLALCGHVVGLRGSTHLRPPRGNDAEEEQKEEGGMPDDGGAGGLLRAFEERSGADPYDNALAESFVTTHTCELLLRHSWPTRESVRTAIFEYIHGFCNPRRRHSALG